MTKYLCIMYAQTYGGSWGVAGTREAARRIARGVLDGPPRDWVYRTIQVPAGHVLKVRPAINDDGVEWSTEPKQAAEAS